jgi:hypothetical protein
MSGGLQSSSCPSVNALTVPTMRSRFVCAPCGPGRDAISWCGKSNYPCVIFRGRWPPACAPASQAVSRVYCERYASIVAGGGHRGRHADRTRCFHVRLRRRSQLLLHGPTGLSQLSCDERAVRVMDAWTASRRRYLRRLSSAPRVCPQVPGQSRQRLSAFPRFHVPRLPRADHDHATECGESPGELSTLSWRFRPRHRQRQQYERRGRPLRPLSPRRRSRRSTVR